MSTFKVVQANGDVVNIIEWDGVTRYDPPPGTSLVKVKAREVVAIVDNVPRTPTLEDHIRTLEVTLADAVRLAGIARQGEADALKLVGASWRVRRAALRSQRA